MTQLKTALFILLSFSSSLGFSNNDPEEVRGEIFGKIFDQEAKAPIEYATISVFQNADSTLVTGTISDEFGYFKISELKKGGYYVLVSFMGYQDYSMPNIQITATSSIDLGTLFLEMDAQQLEEIVVTSEYGNIDYQIDKKVVSVDNQLTSASMSAVEVLENVPSINVDIDGNVLLRGSSGFVVLIDGKPTVLDPSDALRQTPASTILNIEIITNPSSKYVPDGTGGIINIITRKNKNLGISGLANVRAGSFGTYGADLLLNYKKGKSNFFISGELGKRVNPNENFSERRTTLNDTTTTLISNGTGDRNRGGWSLRTGWDWDITPKDAFSLGVRFGDFEMEGGSESSYVTTQTPGNLTLSELTQSVWSRGGRYFNITGNYLHKFSQEKEEISLQVNYHDRKMEERNESFLLDGDGINIKNGFGLTETGPAGGWDIRLDYSKPFGENYLLEVGSQMRFRASGDYTELLGLDPLTNELVIQPDKGNEIDYHRNIVGVYSVFRGNLRSLGYQAGLRGEYTYRLIDPNSTAESFTIDRFDLFPSLHLSYDLPAENQLMANYSRRIDRPRGWRLEPFITWTDLFNVRQGNPALLPEYIDAYELNYIKSWKKTRLSLETYYRVTHNKVNRTTSVYDEGVLLSTYENVGTDYALGVEGMFNIKLAKWWEINLTGNTYDYRISGNIGEESFENRSFNWSSRLSNTFKLHKNLKIQADGRYNSPTATSQGKEEGFYMVNLGVRADFLDKKLSASLQVRDIFSSAKRASFVESDVLYNYRSRLSNAPNISLNLNYRFNNYQQKRRNNEGGMEEGF